MGNPAEERDVFAGFLNAAPMFAGIAVKDWRQPPGDPPDIECDLVDGTRLGIELTSWLDESQIGCAKKKEMMEDSFRQAINPEPPNNTEHVHLVWMDPKRRLASDDAAAFRRELLRAMEEIDRRWDSEPNWETPQGFQFDNLDAYPMLKKYLDGIDIHPRLPPRCSTMEKGGLRWLSFPMGGFAYSPEWAVDALCEVIEAKVQKYKVNPMGNGEFDLLVHYDKAFAYNTPVHGIDFGYPEAVKAAAARIGTEVGVFTKIFVFVPVSSGQQAFQLYP
jgi:hypothetical protein